MLGQYTQVVRGLGAQGEPTAPHRDDAAVVERFMRQHPPAFGGGSDPVEAESWLAALEKIFCVLQCDGRERVRLAVYRLEGGADRWWRECQARRTAAEVRAMDWPEFQDIFL